MGASLDLPTIDWAGGGLVTTAPDLARFVRGLWSGRIVASRALTVNDHVDAWIGGIRVEGVELPGTPASSRLRLSRARVRRGHGRHPQRLTTWTDGRS